jgi:hypothetical protein
MLAWKLKKQNRKYKALPCYLSESNALFAGGKRDLSLRKLLMLK